MEPRNKLKQIFQYLAKFQWKLIKRDRKGYFILIKGKVPQEVIPILNIYIPNARTYTFRKEALLKLKSHITPHTLIIGNFQFFSLITGKVTEKETKQRNNENHRCNDPNGLNISIIYFTQHKKKYLFFSISGTHLHNFPYSQPQSTSPRIKRDEITPCMLSEHNSLKLNLKNNRNNRKPTC